MQRTWSLQLSSPSQKRHRGYCFPLDQAPANTQGKYAILNTTWSFTSRTNKFTSVNTYWYMTVQLNPYPMLHLHRSSWWSLTHFEINSPCHRCPHNPSCYHFQHSFQFFHDQEVARNHFRILWLKWKKIISKKKTIIEYTIFWSAVKLTHYILILILISLLLNISSCSVIGVISILFLQSNFYPTVVWLLSKSEKVEKYMKNGFLSTLNSPNLNIPWRTSRCVSSWWQIKLIWGVWKMIKG